MHELSVALELQRLSLAEVEERGGGRLEAVRVAVGELCGVEPELLLRAWEVACPGVELEIEREPATRTCPDCGPVDGELRGSWLLPCPRCGAPVSIRGGQELDLIEIAYAGEHAPQELPT